MQRVKRLGRGRPRALAVALSVAVALGIGAAANVAVGHYSDRTHYHVYNNVPHGMVHGSSTTDTNWHSRVESTYGNSDWRRCLAGVSVFGPDDNIIGESRTYGVNGTTCNYWVAPSSIGGPCGPYDVCDENAGFAETQAFLYGVETLSTHSHPVFG